MLTGIELKDFRGFADLKLPQLGRVNLVVGKNNAGKTSLLEAITIIASPQVLQSLPGLFRANPGAVSARFYRWLIRDGSESRIASLRGYVRGSTERRVTMLRKPHQPGDVPPGSNSVWQSEDVDIFTPPNPGTLRVRAVSVQHRSTDDMVSAFAEAVRPAEGEAQMESLLRSVDERVKTVRLDYTQNSGQPFIVVDIGLSERVPLSQAGQGIYRLVAIFSELLGQRPQVCFIDEIENGIHYTVLPQVWHGIAEVAKRLDIQVFATTHSRECLLAAHEAFSKRAEYDLRVVQLYRIKDSIEGRVLDREHIQAAVDGEIELR
jgi:hypothetical protein